MVPPYVAAVQQVRAATIRGCLAILRNTQVAPGVAAPIATIERAFRVYATKIGASGPGTAP